MIVQSVASTLSCQCFAQAQEKKKKKNLCRASSKEVSVELMEFHSQNPGGGMMVSGSGCFLCVFKIAYCHFSGVELMMSWGGGCG